MADQLPAQVQKRTPSRSSASPAWLAVYLALGISAVGRKEVVGLWIEQTEGAKFWLKVFNELKNRGLNDILIAIVDGLRGFPDAIEAVYPEAQIQTCIGASDLQLDHAGGLEGPRSWWRL